VTIVSLRQIEGPAGAPWERPLEGALDKLVVESELLQNNPLGDPSRRPLYVYRAPQVEPGSGAGELPSVYVIQGFGGQLDNWLARDGGDPTSVERMDEMFASGGCPAAVIVFVDAWTSRGGSQFLNSTGTGRYMDYLCDEVVPFIDERYPTAATRDRRGLVGKSSGGYGAMVVPMLRPDMFGGLASHAGDALFECCYQPHFPATARLMQQLYDGSWDVFHERLAAADHFDWERFALPFAAYGNACAYSPDPQRPGHGLLPFELETGRIVDDVWTQWLEFDPVRMAPRHSDALRSMRWVYLDAGTSDEFFLDLGAKAFARELEKLGIEHTLELFDGTHSGFAYRYPGAIRELVLALSS
jgi:S-formylglutathione hydrolase FrmB